MTFPWEETPIPKEPEIVEVNPKNEQIIEALNAQLNEDSDEDILMDDVPDHVEPGLVGQFYLSQTLIKELTNKLGMEKHFCPKRIFHLYIAKDFKSRRTEPMLAGLYGESLILGSSAKGDTTKYSLPKNKTSGKMRVAEERILMQVERFKTIASTYQINIIPGINVQVPIFKKFGNVMLRGEMDIFPTSVVWNDELSLAIVDLKFTGDVNSTFSKFSWGDPEAIDYLQGDFYHYLVRDFDLDLNIKHGHEFNQRVGYKNLFTPFVNKVIADGELKFIYVILGYQKADLNNQLLMLNRAFTDPNNKIIREQETIGRIRKAIAILNHEHVKGWLSSPEREECSKCPLNSLFGGPCTDHLKLNDV